MTYRKTLTRDDLDSSRRLMEFLIITALCGVVLAVALPMVMLVISNEPEARRLSAGRFERMAVGATKEQVLETLGPPGVICLGSKGIYPHQIWAGRETWEALEKATVERWIYPLPFEEVKTGQRNTRTEMVKADRSCRPKYAEGEVGFDEGGRVRWFISMTDESHVVHRKKP